MFYETAQTVGPGWHRSYKPSHYEDMTWTPSNRHFRSPGSSPETYRRIIRNDDEFPNRNKDHDDEFFSGRKSPTFPRRIFKEWNEPTSNRFTERPRMFKRVFRPDRWEDEFDRDIPHLRRIEREFDSNFDGGGPTTTTKKFDDEFEKRFNSNFKKDRDDSYDKSDGKVHHIPIMVERRMDEMKSRFGKNDKNSPPHDRQNDEEYTEEWTGPQVQRLRKTFEQPEDRSSRFGNFRTLRDDIDSKPRPYSNSSESWDPHAIHTLPTRKAHKSSQSFDDSRHPVPPKQVFRSYSETHDDSPRQQQPHSTAFRSHSDGHCPKQTHVTKIQVNLPSQKEKDELCSPGHQSRNELGKSNSDSTDYATKIIPEADEYVHDAKLKGRNKYENPAMQQIAVVLQNVEDLVIRVENYNGAGRDKQYRFLDEMLTRCMLRLDDVDTEGREDIRSARKAAVREVQNCIDKLEAKADESERRCRQNKAEENKDEIQSQQKHAIPLEAKASKDDQPISKQAIPLPAGSSEHVPQSNKAIPLNDKPNVNEQKNMAIPLGYTQDSNNNQNNDGTLKPKSEATNGEQTKL